MLLTSRHQPIGKEHLCGAIVDVKSVPALASPDGSYETNLRLAKLRTDKALERILAQLDPETRKLLEVKSDASVASWKEVAELLKKNSKPELAKEVEDLDRYGRLDLKLNSSILVYMEDSFKASVSSSIPP